MWHRIFLAPLTCAMLLGADLAAAQGENETEHQLAVPAPTSGNLPVPPAIQADKKLDKSGELRTPDPAKIAPDLLAHLPLFPSWGRPGFHVSLGPILGYRYTSDATADGEIKTETAEAGLRAGLSDVPLLPGNPGIGLGVGGFEALGLTTHFSTTGNSPTLEPPKIVRFRRLGGSVSADFYWHFLREQIEISRGRIQYDDADHTLVQSARGVADTGLLILSWLSAHYTYEYLRAFRDQYKNPFLESQDYWLHGRLATDLFSWYLDAGPGSSFTTEYLTTPDSKGYLTHSGETDYFKALTGMHLFWKLAGAGEAKYTIDSTQQALGTYTATRLPDAELGQQSNLVQPIDSVQASFFLGLRDVITSGLSFGYRYNLQILNLGRRGGKERETTKDSGLGFSYSAAL